MRWISRSLIILVLVPLLLLSTITFNNGQPRLIFGHATIFPPNTSPTTPATPPISGSNEATTIPQPNVTTTTTIPQPNVTTTTTIPQPNVTTTIPQPNGTLPDEGFGPSDGGGGGFGPSDGGGGGFGPGSNETGTTPAIILTKTLSNNTGDSVNQKIAISRNNVYVVWEDTTNAASDILFIKSTNYGDAFDEEINLSNNPGESFDPQIAVSGNNVYVVWSDDTTTNTNATGNHEIFFTKSNDNGNAFSSPINLSNNPGDSLNPKVAVLGNNVYVLWSDDIITTAANIITNTNATGNHEIFFTKSNDNGNAFSSPINLSNNPGDSLNPKVAVLGNNVYVVWEDNNTTNSNSNDILFIRSINSGSTFSSIRNLSNNPGESFDPQIAVSGNNVYVVWEDYSLGDSNSAEVLFIKSTNYGDAFDYKSNLSNNPGDSLNPKIAVLGNNVYVVWEDNNTTNSNSNDILFIRSINSGSTFSSIRNLSNNPGESFDPQIAVSGNNVYVVWEDTTSSSIGNGDILFVRSVNKGSTFSSIRNLSNNNVESFGVHIAVSRHNVYVIWSDDTDIGNAEVIFTSNTRNAPIFTNVSGGLEGETEGGFAPGGSEPFEGGSGGLEGGFAPGGSEPFEGGSGGLEGGGGFAPGGSEPFQGGSGGLEGEGGS
jgi:hypothetical protein